MNADKWLTTTPEDRSHDTCNCEKCHEAHVMLGYVIEQRNKPDFPCCATEFEDMVSKGQICHLHPEAYYEPGTKDKPGFCEQCHLSR